MLFNLNAVTSLGRNNIASFEFSLAMLKIPVDIKPELMLSKISFTLCFFYSHRL